MTNNGDFSTTKLWNTTISLRISHFFVTILTSFLDFDTLVHHSHSNISPCESSSSSQRGTGHLKSCYV
ncbi:hypothetical protein TorRG33x02_099920 [Trema orientale]|uniref:Uncharacterized protein n=1 Tax=Trema orientale TaxID=63057 RepID=A0A2P5F913_TREOI|nr:hypothetical protein TorRG33x02_099920 [Trema orientale]